MLLLASTSLSIPLFFARRGEFSLGKTAAPLIGGLLIAVMTYLSLSNYPALTGTDLALVNNMPFLFVPIIIFGILHGFYLRKRWPDIYKRVGSTHVEEARPVQDIDCVGARAEV
jgi:hypothetical protein